MSLESPNAHEVDVSPIEAVALIDRGAVLVDVREPDEIAQGHAQDIVAIPLSVFGDHLHDLPRDRTIVVVCRTGFRSARAARVLVDAGYAALNLAGGMEAWRDCGLGVVRDNGSQGIVA